MGDWGLILPGNTGNEIDTVHVNALNSMSLNKYYILGALINRKGLVKKEKSVILD